MILFKVKIVGYSSRNKCMFKFYVKRGIYKWEDIQKIQIQLLKSQQNIAIRAI